MTLRKRAAKVLLLAALLVLAAAVPALALSGSDTGNGGTSSGGGTMVGGAYTYYHFSVSYPILEKWTLGGSTVPSSAASASTIKPYSTSTASFVPYILRGNAGITDHWNAYVVRPAVPDLALDGASAATVTAWASVPSGTWLRDTRGSIRGKDVTDYVSWEYKWHFYWAADPAIGLSGAIRASKDDYDSTSDDQHQMKADDKATWRDRTGAIDGYAAATPTGVFQSSSPQSRIHWFVQDGENYVKTSGTNGSGGKPAMSINMGKLTNRLDYYEGRYALYAYRLDNREAAQKEMLLDTEKVQRPRVRVVVLDSVTGKPVTGATAVLSVANHAGTEVPARYGGKVDFTTPAFAADGSVAAGEDSNHLSYSTATTYDGSVALNGGLLSLGPTYSGGAVDQQGYKLDVTLPNGYTFAGGAGDLTSSNTTYTSDAGTSETAPRVLGTADVGYTGWTLSADSKTAHLYGSNATGTWSGFGLDSGIYTYTIKAVPNAGGPGLLSSGFTVRPYFDANGNHVKDAGEQMLNTSVDGMLASVSIMGPVAGTSTDPTAAFQVRVVSPNMPIVLPSDGDYVVFATVPASNRWKVSYVQKSSGPAGNTVFFSGVPCDLTGGFSAATWDSVSPYHYGDSARFTVHLAANVFTQTAIVGIAAYAAPGVPVLDVPAITGPNAWLDSGKTADFSSLVRDFTAADGSWKREPYYGVSYVPQDADWAAHRKDAPPAVAYVGRTHDRTGSTVDLGVTDQTWTAANANRNGGFPSSYVLPAGNLAATWGTGGSHGGYGSEASALTAAKAAAPQFSPTATGTRLPLSGWDASDALGVNYYGAVLWRVTSYRTVFAMDGTESTTSESWFQWGEPGFKNVKVYTTTGSL